MGCRSQRQAPPAGRSRTSPSVDRRLHEREAVQGCGGGRSGRSEDLGPRNRSRRDPRPPTVRCILLRPAHPPGCRWEVRGRRQRHASDGTLCRAASGGPGGDADATPGHRRLECDVADDVLPQQDGGPATDPAPTPPGDAGQPAGAIHGRHPPSAGDGRRSSIAWSMAGPAPAFRMSRGQACREGMAPCPDPQTDLGSTLGCGPGHADPTLRGMDQAGTGVRLGHLRRSLTGAARQTRQDPERRPQGDHRIIPDILRGITPLGDRGPAPGIPQGTGSRHCGVQTAANRHWRQLRGSGLPTLDGPSRQRPGRR